jgi:phosphoribosyl-AMP cyclohydrolase
VAGWVRRPRPAPGPESRSAVTSNAIASNAIASNAIASHRITTNAISNDIHQGAQPVSTTGTPFTAVPIDYTDQQLGEIAYNSDGLVGAIVQDASDGSVLMFAWMNAESLQRTLETGRTWFWSRSRQEFWCKGETSGDRQYVRSLHYDCDGDALLVVVDQEGAGACHTGSRTCFYRAFGEDPPAHPAVVGLPAVAPGTP